MASHSYRIKVLISYELEVPIEADNEDEALKKLEKVLFSSDDYELVNRSSKRSTQIQEIKEIYGK